MNYLLEGLHYILNLGPMKPLINKHKTEIGHASSLLILAAMVACHTGVVAMCGVVGLKSILTSMGISVVGLSDKKIKKILGKD